MGFVVGKGYQEVMEPIVTDLDEVEIEMKNLKKELRKAKTKDEKEKIENRLTELRKKEREIWDEITATQDIFGYGR